MHPAAATMIAPFRCRLQENQTMASESRLLFMILPPAEIREALSTAFERTGLMSELGDALFAPTNWHQSVSDRYADIAANRERLRDAGAAVRAAPFLMSFERLGSRGKTAGVDLHWEFQSRRKKVDGLIQLIDTLNARLADQQMDAGGGHTPHITVSYRAPRVLETTELGTPVLWRVEDFVLARGGGFPYRYEVLDRWPLTGVPQTASGQQLLF